MSERFFLSQDNDCHWFVVPVARKGEWDVWCEIPGDDERAWDAPDFAIPLNGSPNRVTFTDWREDN
jgi:hypothetical protein